MKEMSLETLIRKPTGLKERINGKRENIVFLLHLMLEFAEMNFSLLVAIT